MAIEYVNSTGGTGSGSVSYLDMTAFSCTTGNTIVVATTNYTSTARTVTGVSDTAGNTYSVCGSQNGGDSSHTMSIWVATNITGNASNVIRVTFSGSATYAIVTAAQYSGLATSSVLDKNANVKLDNPDVMDHSTNTITNDTADELLVAYFVVWDVSYTFSSGTSSTLRRTQSDSALCDRIVNSITSYAVNVNTSGYNKLVSKMSSFRIASAASSGNPWYYYAQQMRKKLEEKLKRRIALPGFADVMNYGYAR